MYILGINAYHGDSSACLLKDGKVFVAAEEERFRRIKHWAGFPSEAIQFCLHEAGIGFRDLECIAISRDPKANFFAKLRFAVMHKMNFSTLLQRFKNLQKARNIQDDFLKAFPDYNSSIPIMHVEHHMAHLASAFFVSPFEKAALISIDGFGDFSSVMTGIGEGSKISRLSSIQFPHSLGLFYSALTQYLGFPHYGDEYKIMGLAPYGKPVYVDKLQQVIFPKDDGSFELNLKYFRHAKEGVKMAWDGGAPFVDTLFTHALENLLGPARKKDEPLEQFHKDIAASVQAHTENIIFHLLNALHKKTGLDDLCLAGGVIQNSVANGKILSNTAFKRMYIPPAAHDAGTAIGAALFSYYHLHPSSSRKEHAGHAYYGFQESDANIEKLLTQKGIVFKRFEVEQDLLDETVKHLQQRKVVGWFQGRAEFGPRALGHRSILADPRRLDAKDLINEKIKRRESFRPFAPSILKEEVPNYFEKVDEVPFMEKVFLIKEEQRTNIPAVTHADGTGRLQTVDAAVEPRYHALIKTFQVATGVPILLNTSFNENEPIVNTAEQALDCFLRTEMDVLVLNNFMVTR